MSQQEKEKKYENKYLSAEIMYHASFEEYNRKLSDYGRIYNRVATILALSGVLLVAMITNLDFSIVYNILKNNCDCMIYLVMLYIGCYLGCIVLMLIAMFSFLQMLKAKKINVFRAVDIYNNKYYKEENEDVYVWIADKYFQSIENITAIIEEKEKKLSKNLRLEMISIVLFVICMFISKGV